MASSFATTASASVASVSKTTHNTSSCFPLRHRHCYLSKSRVSFHLAPKPKLHFSTSKRVQSSWNRSSEVKAQLNEVRHFQWFPFENLLANIRSFMDTILEPSVAFKVAIEGSTNAVATQPKSDLPAVELKDEQPSGKPAPAALASEESMSEIIAQVANLVKLVDSKDVMELQLKQIDCELLIRKKEALPQAPLSSPAFMTHQPAPLTVAPSAVQVVPPAAAAAPSPAPGPAPSPSAAKPAKSSLPPFKCPMTGTFYRSSAPGEPPFVKVGDKVQKGQVLCIIEAMKLMNEIEADQSGTIVEILIEDGKPVSVDTPLFAIEP